VLSICEAYWQNATLHMGDSFVPIG